MGHRYTAEDVIQELDKLVDASPGRKDEAARAGQGGRYARHGLPCCLVGAILVQLGASVATLKDLDRDDKQIDESTHPYWKRFDPVARKLLHYLQVRNDDGRTWDYIRLEAFTARGYWLEPHMPEAYHHRAFPGPWCTKDNVRRIT